MGYCPFSVCVRSRYSRLYRDTTRLGKAGRQRVGACHNTAQQATIRPLLGHDTVRHACDTKRSARGWDQGRDTKICIVVEGGDLVSRYSAARGCDTALNTLRHGEGALLHAWQRATRRTHMALVLGVLRYSLRHGRPGLRHGQPKAMIR